MQRRLQEARQFAELKAYGEPEFSSGRRHYLAGVRVRLRVRVTLTAEGGGQKWWGVCVWAGV